MRPLGTLLLLCLCGLRWGAEAKKERESGAQLPPPPAQKGQNRAVLGSGELTSQEGHQCTWEMSGESQVELRVSCSHGELTYRCRYAGRPGLCPAYAARPSQYWKQAVGRLKKKSHACEGENVLKTRVCKRAPAESHMRLLGEQEEEQEAEEEEEEEEGRKRRKAGGEKQAGSNGEEEERKPATRHGGAFGELNDGSMDTELVERYCAEGWQSFCSFFVKFIDG